MPRTLAASALAAALLLAACSSSGGGQASSPATTASPSAPPSASASASPSPSASASPAPDGPLVVALGDSLAAGYQPGGAELRDSAYPALAAARLSAGGQRLGVANLACSGETTATLVEGGRCTYPEKSQLAAAEALLRERRADVRMVTLDIGGNDLLHCVRGMQVDASCAKTGLGTVRTNLPTVLERLRAAAGPDVPVLVLGYYNPWLAASYLGAGKAQLAAATSAYTSLDTEIATAAKATGSRYVPLTAAFALGDTTPTTFNGKSVPRNVAQVCTLTYICTAFDVHLTDEGAAVVGRVLADAARKAGVA